MGRDGQVSSSESRMNPHQNAGGWLSPPETHTTVHLGQMLFHFSLVIKRLKVEVVGLSL